MSAPRRAGRTTAGLSPADTPVFVREAEYLTYARLLLAQHRPADAQTLLANLERYARNGGLHGSLITVCVLQAQAQQALGQRAQALACLEEAVRLAAPEGYRRAFLDERAGRARAPARRAPRGPRLRG